jgi:predicted DNA-binding ribbon-helix-helix protein
MYMNNASFHLVSPTMPRRAAAAAHPPPLEIERVQTGVKIEKRILKVLKAMAEYHDITLGDLLEGIVLHAFEGKAPFERASLERIAQLKQIYGLDLDARHAHRLREKGPA